MQIKNQTFLITGASSGIGAGGETKKTALILRLEADCQILSVLAASFLGSLMSSLIRWMRMLGVSWKGRNP